MTEKEHYSHSGHGLSVNKECRFNTDQTGLDAQLATVLYEEVNLQSLGVVHHARMMALCMSLS